MATQPFIDIPFGPYLPDLGGAPNPEIPGYLVDAVGVRPTQNGWRGAPAFTDFGVAIGTNTGSTWQGFFANSSTTLNFFVLNSADAKIYESQDYGANWSDVTPAAGAAPTFPGSFFTYELDAILVCSARAPIKRTLTSAVGTDFSNLAGSPPIAVCGAQVRQHVVLAGLVGVDNYGVQWSAIGDHEDWPTPGTDDALAKQAGRQTLSQSLGIPYQVIGGEKFGIVVQQNGLTRMTYEGGSTVYSFDTFSALPGIGINRSGFLTDDGIIWRWYNDHGFWETDGYTVNRLDIGKINDAIFSDLLSHSYASSLAASYIFGAFDQHRSMYVFGAFGYAAQLCYEPNSRTFFWMGESNITTVFQGLTNQSTSKNLGRTLHNINWLTRKLQRLSSDGGTLNIQTGFIEIDPGYRVQLEGVHLLGANGMGSLTIQYKAVDDYTSMSVSSSGFSSLTAASRGMKKQARTTSQFFAFRITGTGAESQLLRGLRIYYSRVEPSQ